MNDTQEGLGTAMAAVETNEVNNVVVMPETASEGVNEAEVTDDAGTDGGFITTEAYDVPPATPKKHRGSISSVALLTTKTGTVGIRVTYHSDDNGRDYESTIWPPAAWVGNPRITRDELAALPTAEGKKQSPLQRFGAAIHNSKQTADIDRIISVTQRAGRTFPRPTYTTVEEFVEQINSVVAGTPVIFTTKEEKNVDPQYQAREVVSSTYGFDFDLEKLKSYTSANGQ